MNKETIKIAKNMINMGLVEKDGDNSWKVDDEIVLRKIENGCSYLSCSCTSCTFNSKALCSRKLACILFEAQDYGLKKLIREIRETAEQHEKANMKIEPDFLFNLANDLGRFI